jgi:hypothetical protein
MLDDRSLLLSNRTKLGWFIKDSKNYIDKTTIIYGSTGSGKSTIIDEIMYLCKEQMPLVFVVAPTNAGNGTYDNRVPDKCIYKDLSIEWLDKLLKRQKDAAEIYNNANKITTLKSIFNLISDLTSQTIEKTIISGAHNSVMRLDTIHSLSFAKKKSQKSQILSERDESLRSVYKTAIRFHKVQLEQRKDLSGQEKAAITYLDFNPRVLLILDDCASGFKEICKKKPTLFKEIFYEGRWRYFTTIISTQDDKEIDSSLRKNTKVSIFTTSQAATSNFERSSNGYPKHEKLRAKQCTEDVFKQDDNDAEHHQKLVYLQNKPDPFRYIIADLYDDFKIGCASQWEFTNRIKFKRDCIDKNNMLYDRYT